MANITITSTRINTSGKGNAVSFHNAVVNGVQIKNLALTKSVQNAGEYFVSFPSKPRLDKAGKQVLNDRQKPIYDSDVWIEATEDRNQLAESCKAAFEATNTQ